MHVILVQKTFPTPRSGDGTPSWLPESEMITVMSSSLGQRALTTYNGKSHRPQQQIVSNNSNDGLALPNARRVLGTRLLAHPHRNLEDWVFSCSRLTDEKTRSSNGLFEATQSVAEPGLAPRSVLTYGDYF